MNLRDRMFSSSKPGDAYVRQWTEPFFVWEMTSCLVGTKPLPRPMIISRSLDLCKPNSMKLNKTQCFSLNIFKIAFSKCHFVQIRIITVTSRQRHGVSNHWQFDWLFNKLYILISTKTSKFRITGPLGGESTADWWVPLAKGHYWGKRFYVMALSCVLNFRLSRNIRTQHLLALMYWSNSKRKSRKSQTHMWHSYSTPFVNGTFALLKLVLH